MRAAAARRPIDSMVHQLLAPLLQARTQSDAVKILSWDVEQGISLYVRIQGRILLIEIEPRDDREPCFDRSERFNICARINFQGGESLTQTEARFVAAVVAMIRKREHLLPQWVRPPAERQSEAREILVDRVLFQEGDGNYYLNPYVGCTIGCRFCYVAQRADLSWSIEGLAEMPWGKRLDIKVNAAEVLARELREHRPGIVRMSPILTDPYQPAERRYRITRGCLETMCGTGFAPLILTRGARALEDLELLSRFERAGIGYSIPTDDDRFRAMVEPAADPVEQRIEALAQFARAGLFTMVVIQPMLPMNPQKLVAQLAPLVRAVRIDRMQFPERYRDLFRQHGIEHALSDAWADETQQRLVAGFREHGVAVDEHDNLVELMSRGR